MEIAVIRILPLWARLLALSNLILHRSSFGFSDQLFVDVLYFVERFLPIFCIFHKFVDLTIACCAWCQKIVCVIQFQGHIYYLNESDYFLKRCSFIWLYDHIHVLYMMYKGCSLISHDHTIIYMLCKHSYFF